VDLGAPLWNFGIIDGLVRWPDEFLPHPFQ
jgi:hypothetical protein